MPGSAGAWLLRITANKDHSVFHFVTVGSQNFGSPITDSRGFLILASNTTNCSSGAAPTATPNTTATNCGSGAASTATPNTNVTKCTNALSKGGEAGIGVRVGVGVAAAVLTLLGLAYLFGRHLGRRLGEKGALSSTNRWAEKGSSYYNRPQEAEGTRYTK